MIELCKPVNAVHSTFNENGVCITTVNEMSDTIIDLMENFCKTVEVRLGNNTITTNVPWPPSSTTNYILRLDHFFEEFETKVTNTPPAPIYIPNTINVIGHIEELPKVEIIYVDNRDSVNYMIITEPTLTLKFQNKNNEIILKDWELLKNDNTL